MQTITANKAEKYSKARSSSTNAKIFNILAITLGILFWIVVSLAQLGWIAPLAIAAEVARELFPPFVNYNSTVV